ncbi:WxL domain-containing protein [Carnobacterium maltaromaticum]|uniref:WxL domain-containing protein n=1 Tax=Carnobacterium maltaromaticum TaxID=2751 RepID=UPI00298BB10E|nr:WxL domain-containing protein [Carnobacterium maltaromaticum]MDW5523890.1 WxL domain-containing protein [Carnobacterium maltaromaticum]
MKLTKLVLLTIATTGAMTLASQMSLAAEADKADSKATVTLEQGEVTGPVDPIDPSEPGGETGHEGPLTIDNVTPFEFGTHDISSNSEIYTATATNPNIQVSDRRGTGQGWTLQVGLSTFVETTDNSIVLKGASLSIPKGVMKSTEGNVSEEPINFGITLDADGSGSDILMNADEKTGMGTWVDSLDSENVKLAVPAGNFAGEYSATLNWSLVDAPTK